MIPGLAGEERVNRKTLQRLLLMAILLSTLACRQAPAGGESPEISLKESTTGQGPLLNHALPPDFHSYSAPHGSGRLIFANLPPGARSARTVMRDCLGSLKAYFDGRVQLQGAVSDPQDQVVQAIVAANLRGQRMRGVATAAIGQSGTTFGLVFDRPDLLKSSFQALSQRLSQEMPKASGRSGPFDLSPPAEWRRQTAGDRTCAVDLPPGWRITGCSQGVVTVVGLHNELIQLGLIYFVSTLPGSPGMAGPYLQPAPAFSYFVNYFTRVNLLQGTNLKNIPGRLLEVRDVPAPMPNGRGAYLLQEVSSNGSPAKVFALVYTAPNLMTGWTLYTSYVSAPADLFSAEFADLMRIWGSWKVDDRVYLRQMQQTIESMSQTRDILRSGSDHQMHAYDNLEESMGLIIRGEERVENRSHGGREDVYTEDTDAVLHVCRERGYDCRRVPADELTKP
jgi:hypothetical protein